jgi:23S rRNA (guanosine2251-2'-O)-methyltransferase
MIVYGFHPVLEALRAGRARLLRVGTRRDARVNEAIRLAASRGVTVERVDGRMLDRQAGGAAHQGIVAVVEARQDWSVADLVAAAHGHAPLLIVLDGVEDPHNFGAILRSADAVGADGVVRQTRRAAPSGAVAAKASAGAAAHVRLATVVNIARALEELRDAGVWTVGLAGDAPLRYDEVDLTLPTALVVGAEGSGLRRLVRERCDVVVSIPMQGHVTSLNVSVATGVVLFEAARQRRRRVD